MKQVELVEMGWVMTDEEAKRQEAEVEERREAMIMADEQDFEAGMELTEEYLAEEVEPHELEELCFLVIQNFVVKRAEMRGETEGLHSDLLKLQEQIALAFMHWDGEGDFDDEVDTVRLLEILIPFIDRAIESAKFASEETVQWLEQLRDGVTHLRDQLAG